MKRKTKGSYRLKCGCLVTDTAYVDKGMCDPCKKEFDEIHNRWIKEREEFKNIVWKVSEFNK